MKHRSLVVVTTTLALALAPVAAAEPPTLSPADALAPLEEPPPAQPPEPSFLEQRVVEELATDGIVLSRLAVRLEIEMIGPKVLVSLIEHATGRAAASTKLDELPADREAAVAALTQVAANLAAQLGATPHPPPPPVVAVIDDRAERARKEAAEQRYKNEAIGFGDDHGAFVYATGATVVAGTTRKWYAYQGELKMRLEGDRFYRAVERPDLLAKYQQHHRLKRNMFIAAAVLGLGGLVVATAVDDGDSELSTTQNIAFASMTVSLIPMTIGIVMAVNPHPISEGEAKRAAHEYNQRLRRTLGLATGSTALAPFATRAGGGVALGGQF